MRHRLRPTLLPGLLALAALTLHIVGVQASSPEPVTVYYNQACADCLHYTDETVAPLLQTQGYTALHRIRLAEQSSRRWVRLAKGLGMVLVGAVILIWFV